LQNYVPLQTEPQILTVQGDPRWNSFPKKIDGIEVLKVLKAAEHLKNTPVGMLNSSWEIPNLTDRYKYGHGVKTHVVKQVGFTGSMKAVSQLGIFWAAVNRPPQPAAKCKPYALNFESIDL